MFSFSDVKMMYDWGSFSDDQVLQFVPVSITDEEAEKIIKNEESAY
ncbi:XkdX family protein [Enterococcus lactis]|nr:XkdX family protein [Enterococcus lactis]MBH0227122.1 XkdX family protein [Enterococcus lactis]